MLGKVPWNKEPPVRRTCLQCGKTFVVGVAHKSRQFCSRKCAHLHRAGKPSPLKGRELSQETRAKISNALKGRLQGKLNPFFGKHHSIETRTKLGNLAKGRHYSIETKKQMSKSIKAACLKPALRKKRSEIMKQRYQNPDERKKDAEAIKRLWQNPEFVTMMTQAQNRKPNKPEERLISIFQEFLPRFKYNGDFSLGVVLGGLIPDFVNVNGKKEVIEVFGDYWHSPAVTKDRWQRSELGRVMAYNSLGYKCLVIWEHELNKSADTEVLNRVNAFFGGKRR